MKVEPEGFTTLASVLGDVGRSVDMKNWPSSSYLVKEIGGQIVVVNKEGDKFFGRDRRDRQIRDLSKT